MKSLVHDFLLETAARTPTATALICGDQRVSFAELAAAAGGIAATLQEMGVRRGDRVMLLLENSVEMVAAVFGIAMAGGVFVPINSTTKAAKLADLIADCTPRVLIAGAAHAPVVDSAGADVQVLWGGGGLDDAMAARPAVTDPGLIDQDLVAIIYTSGSSGVPKGVMLTHRNMANTAWAISTYLGNRPDDVVICMLPMSFDYGLYQAITGARVGFAVVLEKSFAFPWRTLENMAAHRVTGLPGVPTIFAGLLQLAPFGDLDLSALRYVTNTAAALPPAHIRGLREAFPQVQIFSMYGLTECTRVSWLDPARLDDKIGSVGRAMPNSEVYVVDDAGRRLPPHHVGELVVRGANVMRGYWHKPDVTARRLRDGEIEGEKVLYTGDLFRMDAEGFLYFVGRVDDIFKCRGEKVSPKEVEHVLHEIPAVAEAAIVPVPDPVDGMAIKAVVVPREGAALTEDEVRRHCRARLESYLVPRFVEIRASLPRSENGKVRKAALAENTSN
ncbi:MAG: AMP-binding protein [Rhodospirillaceae bacterium]